MSGVGTPAPSPAAQAPSRTLGLVALILAAVAFIGGLVFSGLRISSIVGGSASPNPQPYAGNYLTLLFAVVAIVMGAIAWRRRGAGSVLGSLATGLGVAVAAPLVTSIIELLALTVRQLATYHP